MSHTEVVELQAGDMGCIDVKVEFSYDPAEKGYSDHPACDAEYHIISVHAIGKDIHGKQTKIDITTVCNKECMNNICAALEEIRQDNGDY